MASRCTTYTGYHTGSAASKDREAAGRRARGFPVSDVVVNGVHERIGSSADHSSIRGGKSDVEVRNGLGGCSMQ
jgi:hypothetical protein